MPEPTLIALPCSLNTSPKLLAQIRFQSDFGSGAYISGLNAASNVILNFAENAENKRLICASCKVAISNGFGFLAHQALRRPARFFGAMPGFKQPSTGLGKTIAKRAKLPSDYQLI
ncbi:MAG: hypothetical protein ABJZ69_11400 [Hyphomicrobiales bacterium]